jgi:hypothetical protein
MDFLFHKSGTNKGKPRGYAFVEFMNEVVSCRSPSVVLVLFLTGLAGHLGRSKGSTDCQREALAWSQVGGDVCPTSAKPRFGIHIVCRPKQEGGCHTDRVEFSEK